MSVMSLRASHRRSGIVIDLTVFYFLTSMYNNIISIVADFHMIHYHFVNTGQIVDAFF